MNLPRPQYVSQRAVLLAIAWSQDLGPGVLAHASSFVIRIRTTALLTGLVTVITVT